MTSPTNDTLARLLAVALCVPSLVLALPSGPLAGDAIATELSATGLATILILPAAALSIFTARGRTPGLVLLLAYWLWTAFGATRGGTDSLESDRALMMVALAGVATIAGAGLNVAGRRTLASGLVAVSLVASLATLHLRFEDGNWAGPLGNSGETALVLLPGAIVGAWRAARGGGWARWLGGLAFALAVVVTAAPPSLAALGALAFGAGLGLLAAFRGTSAPRARLAFGGATVLALLAFAWFGFLRPTGVPDAPTRSEQAVGNASGLAVRAMVVPPSLELVAEEPLFGVGAGQFVARFPEVRDPEEIERSTHGRKVANETEVEHPHVDVLLPFVESGVLGGLLFLGFLLFAAWRAVQAIRPRDAHSDIDSDGDRAALAAAVLGVLLVGTVWYPLTFLAASAVPSFAAIGALLANDEGRRTTREQRLVPVAAALLLAMFVPRASAIVAHGRALASITPDSSPADWNAKVDEALEACPDSVVALILKRYHLKAADADLDEQRLLFERVLALRPHHFEATMGMGYLALQAGDEASAAAWFARARALDPYHPTLLRNLVRLAYFTDDFELADSAVSDLRDSGRFEPMPLVHLGGELLLAGRIRAGTHALAAADERLADLSPEEAKAFEREYRTLGAPKVGEGFETLAHVLWARQQAEAGAFDDARRSLRQALRSPRLYHSPEGPPRLRMELAATLYRTQRDAEAAEIMRSIDPTPRDWLELPDWAGETLLEEGWMSGGGR